MECKNCEYDFSEEGGILDPNKNWYSLINEKVECPKCGQVHMLNYDEIYDSENEEEYPMWDLVKI